MGSPTHTNGLDEALALVPRLKEIQMLEVTAAHFDQWMDEFMANPEEFLHQFQSVAKHMGENALGTPHTYGSRCIKYLESMKLTESGQATPPLV